MRKNGILVVLLILTLAAPAFGNAAVATPVDWDWVVAQVEAGAETITLPNDIICDEEAGLAPEGTLRIEGNGYALTGVYVDSGTVIFKDVRLLGTHGVDTEDGGDALVLRGEGAIAVLMGYTRAEGGRSGANGERGGDGVQLLADGQGLILNGTVTATGGIGRAYGGNGVRVDACGCSILQTDQAALVGALGLAEGGAGLYVPACSKVTLHQQASATGGNAQYTGGNGIDSHACAQCEDRAPMLLDDTALAIGAAGQDGGNGILLARDTLADDADLTLGGTCMLIGGDGAVAGSALVATNAAIEYAGEAHAYGGRYYEIEMPVVSLTDCEVRGNIIATTNGEQTTSYPASGISAIIQTALSQQSDRYVPVPIEDGLNVRATDTKLNGFTVDSGSASQASVNGGGLKIFMHGGTLENRMQFRQRLMDDGEDGTRLVLIGTASDEWPTIETTVAALRKLSSIGITQLAYTCVSPTYHERILDIGTLIAAIDAYEEEHDIELTRILCGTADDAVIFLLSDGTRDYQEELMPEAVRAES